MSLSSQCIPKHQKPESSCGARARRRQRLVGQILFDKKGIVLIHHSATAHAELVQKDTVLTAALGFSVYTRQYATNRKGAIAADVNGLCS